MFLQDPGWQKGGTLLAANFQVIITCQGVMAERHVCMLAHNSLCRVFVWFVWLKVGGKICILDLYNNSNTRKGIKTKSHCIMYFTWHYSLFVHFVVTACAWQQLLFLGSTQRTWWQCRHSSQYTNYTQCLSNDRIWTTQIQKKCRKQ